MKKIDIRISDNRLQAYMTINSFDGLTLANIIESIQENGIIYGILVQEIQRVFENKIENRETLIAQGKEPIEGKNGDCTSYIDRNISSHTYKTKGDFGNIPIYNVRKGQKLLRIKQHIPGVQGITVNGEMIISKHGKSFNLIRGQNTEFSKYNPEYLLSKVDGNLAWDGNEINISSDYKIIGDVTSHNGNIDFVGNLLIKGDVASGVEIKTLGNLEIDGNVENAKITSSGNVTIKGRCYGNRRGIISAKGDITVSKVENYTLKSLKGIIIQNDCFASTLEAFSILAPNASISEGFLSAFEFIEVKDFGYKINELTKILIGNKLYKMRLIKELDKYIIEFQNSLIDLDERYNTFLSKKMKTGFIEPEEEFDMFLLTENINDITAQIEDLLLWQKTLAGKLSSTKNSKLIVNGTIYPNASLYINDLRYEKSEIYSNSIFVERHNTIVRFPK